MREEWYFPQVIRVRLERTTNGLKDHCYDVLISDNIGLTDTLVEVYPHSTDKKLHECGAFLFFI